MIALDTTALSALFIPGAKLCRTGTNIPIKHGKERLEALVERIAKERDAILIPTPVLSELLVCISPDKIADLLTQLNASIWFRVEAFDSAAAVELGVRTAKAIAVGDKREGAPANTPWTKVKFDRQIIAIAIVNAASEIISDDAHIKEIGERWGVKVTSVEDLPIPKELVPPPLLAALEDDTDGKEESSVPIAPDIRSGGDRNPKDKTTTGSKEEIAESQQAQARRRVRFGEVAQQTEQATGDADADLAEPKSETPVSVKPTGDPSGS